MLIPSVMVVCPDIQASLSRRVNANSQLLNVWDGTSAKLIKKGEC